MYNDNVYLYGVIPRIYDGAYNVQGVQGFPVSLYSYGDLSAAISFIPVDAERGDQRAHRRVMRQLLTHAAVLPAPEPTILPSRVAVQQLLTEQQSRMLDQLRRVQGLIEVRLQVFNRRAANAPVGSGAAPGIATQPEVNDERAYLLARYSRALRSGGFVVQPLPLRHAQTMLRLACLLPRASLELFAFTCEALKSRLDPMYELSVSEPMAPIDFVNPHLFASQQPAPPVGSPALIPVPHLSAFVSPEYRLRS